MNRLLTRRGLGIGTVSAAIASGARRSPAADSPGRVVQIDRPGFYRLGIEGQPPEPVSRADALGPVEQPEPIRSEVLGSREPGSVVESREWRSDPRSSCTRCPDRCAAFPIGDSRWRCFVETPEAS